MTVKGIRSGVSRGVWRNYDPMLFGTNVSGTPTMPDLGNGTLRGRYLDHPSGLVVAQVELVLGSSSSLGNGDALIIGLPKPANRWTANLSNNATADLPIGTAQGFKGGVSAPTLTMPFMPTLADPLAGINLQTNEDNFAHFFCAHSISRGTGAVISGTNTFVDVTHDLGMTPVASDIHVQPVSRSGTPASPRAVYIDNITATNFRINVVTAPGAGTSITFDWKIRAEPNNSGVNLPQLVSYRRPWVWGSTDCLKAQFVYEPR
jgi:hypothetical protein